MITRNLYFFLSVLMTLVLLNACKGDSSGETTSSNQSIKQPNPTQEELFKMNKRLMNEERSRINHFIKRNRWPVSSTGTGLKYWVYETSEGDSVKERDIVKVRYNILLLTGDTCYKRWDQSEQFTVDFDQVESGLHEGIKYMKKGEKARLILPPHLAHGLIGDMNKIPMNATLIYDIQVIDE
jgi:FKBP-type peptidyl-prolyl cis-trans isomerase FkpA